MPMAADIPATAEVPGQAGIKRQQGGMVREAKRSEKR